MPILFSISGFRQVEMKILTCTQEKDSYFFFSRRTSKEILKHQTQPALLLMLIKMLIDI